MIGPPRRSLTLARMEIAQAETQRHLGVIERQIAARAERMTVNDRARRRQHGRSASRRAPRPCGDPMDGADNPKWMSDQNIGRYRAIADECYARAEHARYVLDKEAWLKLAAEWTALAEGAAWRRSNG